jgi:hypothetical protein
MVRPLREVDLDVEIGGLASEASRAGADLFGFDLLE